MSGYDRHTRARVLKVAARLFAERGFRKVTVRDICTAADANVAAVNYHFRDKMGLYREVLEDAIGLIRAGDAAEMAGAAGSAEDRFRAHIQAYLHRLLVQGGDSWVHRLVYHEIAEPTPVLDRIVEHAFRPRVEYLCGLVGEILQCDPADARVRRSVASIQAQCVMLLPHPIGDRLRPRARRTPAEIDQLARHIADFSLAGIRAVGRPHAGR
jgi:AcrR family transcriptional regulator